jgi:hypothetical protein
MDSAAHAGVQHSTSSVALPAVLANVLLAVGDRGPDSRLLRAPSSCAGHCVCCDRPLLAMLMQACRCAGMHAWLKVAGGVLAPKRKGTCGPCGMGPLYVQPADSTL